MWYIFECVYMYVVFGFTNHSDILVEWDFHLITLASLVTFSFSLILFSLSNRLSRLFFLWFRKVGDSSPYLICCFNEIKKWDRISEQVDVGVDLRRTPFCFHFQTKAVNFRRKVKQIKVPYLETCWIRLWQTHFPSKIQENRWISQRRNSVRLVAEQYGLHTMVMFNV